LKNKIVSKTANELTDETLLQ